jgi:hypothetical protein
MFAGKGCSDRPARIPKPKCEYDIRNVSGRNRLNWVCWAQNSSWRWDVGLCECGDEHSGYEAGGRFVGFVGYSLLSSFVGYLGYSLLSSSATFCCETSQVLVISCYVLHLTTLSFAKIKWLQCQMDKMRLWRISGKIHRGKTNVRGE